MKKVNTDKKILDACCGGRMFWFNKQHPNVLYIDKRYREKGFLKQRPGFEVAPDMVEDFRNMPFPDESFHMVVFDPPHTIRNKEEGGLIAERYGRLTIATWENDIGEGFKECWRVLKPNGTLIFKWAENDRRVTDLEHLFPAEPLFGTRTGARDQTIWLCFMKL